MPISFVSTRNDSNSIGIKDALLHGLAPDGGLIVPRASEIPQVDYTQLLHKSYKEIAFHIINLYFSDLGEGLSTAVNTAYKDFDRQLNLVTLNDCYVLELFNGKTGAFKDMALTLLPYLMQLAKRKEQKIIMLTATSGDTGKAALEAFKDIDGIKVIVFFPEDGVSHSQKLQMTTQTGENLKAVAMRGNFDHAQRAVKEAFSDKAILSKATETNQIISSCNSINIGRLIPQIPYYFYAYLKLVESKQIQMGDKINFSVPSGNFGNILAGYYAKQMGLPIEKLFVGSNKNNVLTDFINTGSYDIHREFYKTMAPSMDILVSSNVERLLYNLVGAEETKSLMEDLKKNGNYTIDKRLLQDFMASYCEEEKISSTIQDICRSNQYYIDTHTACSVKTAKEFQNKCKTVVLGTASIYKFSVAVVKSITGLEQSEEEAFAYLKKHSNQTPVESLCNLNSKQILHTDVINKEEINEKIMDFME